MLGGTGMKKLFLLKMLEGAGIRKTPFNLLGKVDMKELFSINMLGRADPKKLNSRKNARETDIGKASLTLYVGWGWHEKPLLTENARQGWYRKRSFNLIY